jgi:hypothetical protein
MLTDQKQKNNSAPASEDTSSTEGLSPPPNIKSLPLTKDKSCRDELSDSYIVARQEPDVVFHFSTPFFRLLFFVSSSAQSTGLSRQLPE